MEEGEEPTEAVVAEFVFALRVSSQECSHYTQFSWDGMTAEETDEHVVIFALFCLAEFHQTHTSPLSLHLITCLHSRLHAPLWVESPCG